MSSSLLHSAEAFKGPPASKSKAKQMSDLGLNPGLMQTFNCLSTRFPGEDFTSIVLKSSLMSFS